MSQMDWMIASIMQIAVFVCRLTVYASVNGVIVVNFINTSKKGNAVEASYVKVILGCVLLELLKKCLKLPMPCEKNQN